MRRPSIFRTLPAVAMTLAIPALALAEPPEAEVVSHALRGKVTTRATPLADARVYAYQMSDLSLQRVDTDNIGSFLFEELPAGLYKIIAIKAGFVPAVVLLQRQTARTEQYLEVDLAPQDLSARQAEQSFWSLRKKIPADVLRDLETLELADEGDALPGDADGFELRETRFAAMLGADDAVPGSGQMNRSTLGFAGSVGATEFDLTGEHWIARGQATADASYSNQVALSVSGPEGTRVRLITSDSRMDGDATPGTVGLERYQVSWSQQLGPGSSEVRAEFVDESNFFSRGLIQPLGVPTASRVLNLEGTYTGPVLGSESVRAGFRYRQVEDVAAGLESLIPAQRVDLFGSGQMLVRPKIYVQYGLYSTLRDGSLSLVPQGGVMVELGHSWTATTTASHQVERNDPSTFDFAPIQHTTASTTCRGEVHCYQLELSRTFSDETELSIGATHREFDETLRLYFSDDFFDHLESLYLVEGDSLPEVQVAMTHRISPRILARLESSVAAGGGGVFYATDENSYENNVRYLVTSLDTRFETTETGVFLAFHHLEQELEPQTAFSSLADTDLEMQRLQLMLTQDLSALNLASLAVRLNMELSRGDLLQGFQSDEISKRVMGGVAVSF